MFIDVCLPRLAVWKINALKHAVLNIHTKQCSKQKASSLEAISEQWKHACHEAVSLPTTNIEGIQKTVGPAKLP